MGIKAFLGWLIVGETQKGTRTEKINLLPGERLVSAGCDNFGALHTVTAMEPTKTPKTYKVSRWTSRGYTETLIVEE